VFDLLAVGFGRLTLTEHTTTMSNRHAPGQPTQTQTVRCITADEAIDQAVTSALDYFDAEHDSVVDLRNQASRELCSIVKSDSVKIEDRELHHLANMMFRARHRATDELESEADDACVIE